MCACVYARVCVYMSLLQRSQHTAPRRRNHRGLEVKGERSAGGCGKVRLTGLQQPAGGGIWTGRGPRRTPCWRTSWPPAAPGPPAAQANPKIRD